MEGCDTGGVMPLWGGGEGSMLFSISLRAETQEEGGRGGLRVPSVAI